MGRTLDLKNELQETYWKFITQRTKEYIENSLSGRIVIELRKGEIQQIYDQAVIAGSTAANYYLDDVAKI